MEPKTHLCERARAWSSLRTDGELSELESALLDAHLGRCEPCRSFAHGAEAVAAALRSAALLPAAPVVVVPLRARRTGIRALQVAAAVAVVVSAGIVAAVTGPSGNASAAKPVSMVAGLDSPDRLRELRRPALVEQGRVIPRNRQGEAV
jgi:predicted anti-sigma-YlaC factor YlaD